MSFSLDPNQLLLSMLVSGIGTILFIYGKRQARPMHMLFGVIYVIYPYFISNLLATMLIAAFLGIGLWVAVRLGW